MTITLKQKADWLDSDVETVISLFLGRIGGRDGILLESAEFDGRWGRFSLAAGDFLLRAVCRDGRLALEIDDERLEPLRKYAGRPYLDGLRQVMAAVELKPDPDQPPFPPITRALYGYLGYGASEGVFALPGSVYLFDHAYNQLARISLLEGRAGRRPGPAPRLETRPEPGRISAALNREDYLRAAAGIRDLISRGQATEVFLANQFSAEFKGELFEVYRRLRRLKPSPYMFFLRQGDFSLAASSPEVLAGCDQGRLRMRPSVESRRPDQSPDEDNLFEEEMYSDPKALARQVMLVEMAREDLGRVAGPGSVKVDRFMEVEDFSRSQRLTSRLSADLAPGLAAVDLIEAVFPAGAVSGGPRARAMEIIADYENVPRGPYGGALGWLGLDRDQVSLDLGLTIRALWTRGGRIFWQAGSGLRQDSDLEMEWKGCLQKARAGLAAISPEPADDFFQPPLDGWPAPAAPVPAEPVPAPETIADAVGLEKTPARLPKLMETVADGVDLNPEMAGQLFARLMDGELNPSQAGALLMGLRAKGETPVEMAEAAAAVLERAVSLPPLPGPVLDVVGTGGDGRNSFNCSTATALVMAGLGYKVVKHGNRSISSRSGSADVLELLGFDLASPPEKVPELLAERNFAFLFAPNYHPAFSRIMPVRKELGIRTLFNVLGPLVNPAKPDHSFLGAHDEATAALLAGALARMKTAFSAAVHGAGGYDELTTMGPATVYLVEGGQVSRTSLDPARFGFKAARPEDLAISGPREGVAVLRELLAGGGPQAMRDMLILNVAMAVYVRRGALTFDDCLAEARRAVSDAVGLKALPAEGEQ